MLPRHVYTSLLLFFCKLLSRQCWLCSFHFLFAKVPFHWNQYSFHDLYSVSLQTFLSFLLFCRIDLCHQPYDDSYEEEDFSIQEALLAMRLTNPSSTHGDSNRICLHFRCFHVGSRQKIVVLVWAYGNDAWFSLCLSWLLSTFLDVLPALLDL